MPTFCSRHVNHQAWATDALSISWKGILGYAFPRISLLPRVLEKIDQEICKILLITPFWPRQAWFPRLLDLLAKAPRSPDTTNLQGTSCISRQSLSLCLDVIKMSFQTAGLSDTAAALAAKSRRAFTRKTYDNRLQHHIKWCSQKAVNAYSASLTDIGDFFVRLFDSRLQIATIQGYRSAIGVIHKGFDDGSNLSNNALVCHLIKGMFVERPPAKKLISSWDLVTILHKLAKAPFEPAGSSSLHHLTVKTPFCWQVQQPFEEVNSMHFR